MENQEKTKLNANNPKEALQIIDSLTNGPDFKFTKMQCRIFDQAMATLSQAIVQLEVINKNVGEKIKKIPSPKAS